MPQSGAKQWKLCRAADRLVMDYRTIAYYLALISIVVSIAEILVRMKGIGARVEKVKGVVQTKKPKLAPVILFLIFSIILAAVTFPR